MGKLASVIPVSCSSCHALHAKSLRTAGLSNIRWHVGAFRTSLTAVVLWGALTQHNSRTETAGVGGKKGEHKWREVSLCINQSVLL